MSGLFDLPTLGNKNCIVMNKMFFNVNNANGGFHFFQKIILDSLILSLQIRVCTARTRLQDDITSNDR